MWKLVSGVVVVVGVVSWYLFQDGIKTQKPEQLNPQYDYIIVGGGSAGSVLAARLSEDPERTVLLLEAGPPDHSVPWWSHIPGLVPFLQQTPVDWQFQTVPQTNACLGIKDRRSRWPRGKVLGGTSVLNYMLHVRATSQDHDRWEKELGCTGWGWDHLLHYYKKLEAADFEGMDTDMRGRDGKINCVRAPQTTIGKAFLAGVEEEGYPLLSDINGKERKGFGRSQMSTKRGYRQSTLAAYLRPAIGRFNLHVVSGAHVTKINFNEDGGTVGVDYSYNNKMRRVLTNKEVILSAGTIGSPHLLLLSGLGPSEHLADFQIPVVKEVRSVGENLKDQVLSSIVIKLNDSVGIDARSAFTLTQGIKALYQFLVKGEGLLSWSLVEILGHLSSGFHQDKGLLDLQTYFFSTDAFKEGFFSYLVNLNEETTKATYMNLDNQASITVGSCLLHPQSSGRVRLQSKDPFVPPAIDPQYLTHSYDIKPIAKGLRLMLDILKSPSLSQYKPEIAEGILPGCRELTPWSEEYLECFVRHKTFSMYHPIGTAKMGPDPTTSVVAPDLRVHGIKGLRVVDASVFPSHVTANTNIPVIALAEKAADMINNPLS